MRVVQKPSEHALARDRVIVTIVMLRENPECKKTVKIPKERRHVYNERMTGFHPYSNEKVFDANELNVKKPTMCENNSLNNCYEIVWRSLN